MRFDGAGESAPAGGTDSGVWLPLRDVKVQILAEVSPGDRAVRVFWDWFGSGRDNLWIQITGFTQPRLS